MLAIQHGCTALLRIKTVLYDEYSTGGAFDTPTQNTINIRMSYMYMHVLARSVHVLYVNWASKGSGRIWTLEVAQFCREKRYDPNGPL